MGLDFFRRARRGRGGPRARRHGRSRIPCRPTASCSTTSGASSCARTTSSSASASTVPANCTTPTATTRPGGPVFDQVVAAARLACRSTASSSTSSARSTRPTPATRSRSTASSATSSAPATCSSSPSSRRDAAGRSGRPGTVTARSVQPDEYGRFLIEIFDEWVRRDVGEMFVQFFDGVLAAYVRGSLQPVRPPARPAARAWPWSTTATSTRATTSSSPRTCWATSCRRRWASWCAPNSSGRSDRPSRPRCPRYCRACAYLFACHGECPKNRVLLTPDGEPGLNWLCAGLKAFFAHADRPMRLMADILSAAARLPR